MHGFAAAMEHDLARPHRDAAPDRGWLVMRRERNEHRSRRQPDKGDARHGFGDMNQAEAVDVNPGPSRLEVTMAGQNEPDAHPRHAHPVVIRIGKDSGVAPDHRPALR